MQPVIITHKKLATFLVTLAIGLHLFVLKHVLTFLERKHPTSASAVSDETRDPLALVQNSLESVFSPLNLLALILGSTGLYAAVVWFPIWLFERGAWKFFHPELVISGTWKTEFTYTHKLGLDTVTPETSIRLSGEAQVTQRWNGSIGITGVMNVEDSIASNRVRWESQSCQMKVEEGGVVRLTIVYQSHRLGSSAQLEQGTVKGVEELTVSKSEGMVFSRPTAMIGEFYGYVPWDRRSCGTTDWKRVAS
ncbi:MAG: hypothetical protein JNJ83_12760 [Verrucomicrobiaceae bacterium]|nr:hypothetical protein [Verrucomicrobiaceae bacterium]